MHASVNRQMHRGRYSKHKASVSLIITFNNYGSQTVIMNITQLIVQVVIYINLLSHHLFCQKE